MTPTSESRSRNRLRTQFSEGRLQPTALGGLLVVLASALASLAAYGALDDEMRIRWSVGTHYGPEHASTLVVLAAFPALVAACYVGLRWLGGRLADVDEFETVRPLYELSVLAVLGMLVVVQMALIAANFW